MQHQGPAMGLEAGAEILQVVAGLEGSYQEGLDGEEAMAKGLKDACQGEVAEAKWQAEMGGWLVPMGWEVVRGVEEMVGPVA